MERIERKFFTITLTEDEIQDIKEALEVYNHYTDNEFNLSLIESLKNVLNTKKNLS